MAPKVRTEFHRPEAVKKHSPHTADREESPAAWISPIALGLGLLGLVFKVPPGAAAAATTTTPYDDDDTYARACQAHARKHTHARTHARRQIRAHADTLSCIRVVPPCVAMMAVNTECVQYKTFSWLGLLSCAAAIANLNSTSTDTKQIMCSFAYESTLTAA